MMRLCCPLIAAILATLLGACATPAAGELEPPAHPALARVSLEAPFEAIRTHLFAPTPRSEPDACRQPMDDIERRIRQALADVEGRGDADAARRLRDVLAELVERPLAPMTVGERDFVWAADVLRTCAENARLAGAHDRALELLDALDRAHALDPDDRRRRAWSLAELGRTRDALYEMAEIPAGELTDADRARIALWFERRAQPGHVD